MYQDNIKLTRQLSSNRPSIFAYHAAFCVFDRLWSLIQSTGKKNYITRLLFKKPGKYFFGQFFKTIISSMPHLRTSGSITKLTLIGDEYDLRLGPPILLLPVK